LVLTCAAISGTPATVIRSCPVQDISHPFVFSHPDWGIEFLFSQVIAPALTIDQTPAFQLAELAGDGRAGHAHVSGNLGNRKRPAVEIADRYAQANETRFQAHAEGLARGNVSLMHGSQDIDHQAVEHQSLPRFLDFTPMAQPCDAQPLAAVCDWLKFHYAPPGV
jgi:hypothetical protein